MKKIIALASSVVLTMAASSSFAAIYDVSVNLSATISGGGGGSQSGSGSGTYDTDTQIMLLTSNATVSANGLFGIGKGTMNQTYDSIFNFSTLSGTNNVVVCTNITGSSCSLTPSGPQALKSVTAINWNTMKFQDTSVYSIATTTQNWTITSYTPQAVPPPAVPVPAAAWLFGSALLGVTGVSRRRAKVS